MSSRARMAIRAALAALVLASAPSSLGAGERDTLLPPLVISGEVGNGLWGYGQLDKGLLVYDDGAGARAYPLVDNAASSTRAGLWWRRAVGDGLTVSANGEVGWDSYSTGNVSRWSDGGIETMDFLVRKAEVAVESDRWGRAWAGLGSSASDGTSEQDLSGTSLALYSSVGDPAGGQAFLFQGGGRSPLAVGATFSNFDGLGRIIRLRYDTPSWRGARLSASAGYGATLRRDSTDVDNGLSGDLSLSWSGEVRGLRALAAAALSRTHLDRTRANGSVSLLDPASGVSLTVAAAAQDSGPEPWLAYAKLGWQGRLAAWGKTAAAVDVYWGDELVNSGSRSFSLGAGVVQALPDDWRAELFGVVRVYDLHVSGVSLRTGVAAFSGVRVSF